MWYRTKEGDTADRIAYLTVNGNIPALLDQNPRLADYGVELPAGLLIDIPEEVIDTERTESEGETLW